VHPLCNCENIYIELRSIYGVDTLRVKMPNPVKLDLPGTPTLRKKAQKYNTDDW
jgi:hypothetical protein